ncbi:NfeD family protein [Argonema antarcticum]|uniref:NfeD family protein n=1 Tax=Argonema antarcticum TaxID=2942763 RepID=UPI0020133845|nr:NfeD family protein [Argonema antarcticum]MCL1475648.1 NfeD family protein [Argonema antarcticum A004/B2]
MSEFLTISNVAMLPEPKRGTVEKAIAPGLRGRVKALGSYWPAEFYQPEGQVQLLPGEIILVVGIKNITLLIVPLS